VAHCGHMDLHGQATLTADDFADAQMAIPAVTKTHRFLAFILAVAALQILTSPVGMPTPVAVACAVAIGLGLYSLRRRLLRRGANKTLSMKQPGELDLRYQFTDAGYKTASCNRSSEATWESLYGWIESPNIIALQTAQQNYEVIPKRALAGDDVAALRAVLQQRVRARTGPGSLFGRYRWLILWAILVLLFFTFYSMFSRPR
jgi:YcxB-like protein